MSQFKTNIKCRDCGELLGLFNVRLVNGFNLKRDYIELQIECTLCEDEFEGGDYGEFDETDPEEMSEWFNTLIERYYGEVQQTLEGMT